MKVFVINLARDTERMAKIDARLRELGVSFERVEGVFAKGLPSRELAESVNRFRWWCAVGRPVRPGEIGCAMSHYAIYRRMEDERIDMACVFEDDIKIEDRFSELLRWLEGQIDTSRPQVILLSNYNRRRGGAPGNGMGFGLVKERDALFADGYVVTLPAAVALAKANWPMQVPCDHWGRWVKRGIIELFHSVPNVCRQDRSEGYKSGTVDGDTFRVADLPPFNYACHKFKRLIGKSLDWLLSFMGR